MKNIIEEKRDLSTEEIAALNRRYSSLSPRERLQQIYLDFDSREIMLTTSFAATSAFLLKLVSETNPDQLIHFVDTGFHFKETMIYKDYLVQLYDLRVEELRADPVAHAQTVQERTWERDADRCCQVNKVSPLNRISASSSIWISGLMRWQSDHRASLDIFEKRGGLLKFYPLLDVSKEERHAFISDHHLPFHPLVNEGYESIGCRHCTLPGAGRDGRWNNSPKTECGLHL